MAAAAALVFLGVILVVLGILAQFSIPVISLGLVALIAAGVLQVMMTRRS